jgi:hypothetical protein
MAILTEFKSSLPSCVYALKDGTQAIFMFGRYRTDNEAYIAELKHEIALKHPHISGGEQVDTVLDNPLVGLEAKFRAKFLAEQAAEHAAAIDKSRDMGGNLDTNKNFGALTSDGSLLSVGSEETKVGVTDTSKPIPVVPVTSSRTAPSIKLTK